MSCPRGCSGPTAAAGCGTRPTRRRQTRCGRAGRARARHASARTPRAAASGQCCASGGPMPPSGRRRAVLALLAPSRSRGT
eukprot:4646191-Prymnesium_polylepis.2